MAVSVHVPVRLRVDTARPETCLDDIERAVCEAAGRALTRSRVAVLEPRAGYASVSCRVPTFSWRGDVAGAPQPLREEIERRVIDALARASERAGLFDVQTDRPDAPEVLPDEIAEPLDPLRFDEELGLYEIPSYNGPAAKKTTVRVKTKRKPASKGETEQRPLTFGIAFDEFPDDINNTDFWNTFGWRVAEHFGPGRAPRIFGIVYRIAGEPAPFLSTVEQDRGTVQRWLVYRLPLVMPPLEASQSIPVALTQWGAFKWTRMPDTATALTKWRASYRRRLIEHYAPAIKIKRGGEEAAKKAAEDKADKVVGEATRGWETEIPLFYLFKHPAGSLYCPINKQLVDVATKSAEVEVVPLAHKVEISTDGEGGAGAGDKGKGAGRYALAPGQIPGFGGGDGAGDGPGVIAREYDSTSTSRFPHGRPLHPVFGGRRRFTPVCQPYLREPSVLEMGPGGMELWGQIQKVARLLEMEPCPYAANFAINAAKVLGARVGDVGDVVRDLKGGTFVEDLSVGAFEGGQIVFKPVPSPAMQHLRELARIIPVLDDLYEMIRKTLFPISAGLARGYFILDFDHELESDVVWIYLYACQILLLQQIDASHENIDARLDKDNFDAYVQLTELLISDILTDQLELVRIRDALHRFGEKRRGLTLDDGDEVAVFSEDPDFAPTWTAYYDLDYEMRIQPSLPTPQENIARHERWVEMYRKLDEFRGRDDLYFRYFDRDRVVRSRAEKKDQLGRIAKRATDGEWVIFDGHGNDWSLKQLDAAVGVRQQYLEQQDPILKHIEFRSDVPRLARDKSAIRPFLSQLLGDMREKNEEVRSSVLSDPKWAFEHSKIDKPEGAVSYFGYQSGLHRMAHEALYDAFSGTSRYYWSINHLYDHQLGWVSLRDTLLFVGITFLSIFCPPLGAIAGLGEAIWRYREAKEMKTFYDALLDPRELVNRAEVEAQMFAARLGLALSFIPVAGEISSVAGKSVKAALSQGLRTGLRAVLKQHMDELAEKMIAALGPGLVTELAQIPVMTKVMESILEPAIDDYIRQIDVSLPLAPKEEDDAAYVDAEDDV